MDAVHNGILLNETTLHNAVHNGISLKGNRGESTKLKGFVKIAKLKITNHPRTPRLGASNIPADLMKAVLLNFAIIINFELL